MFIAVLLLIKIVILSSNIPMVVFLLHYNCENIKCTSAIAVLES